MEMENMGIVEEWMKSIVAPNTKKHHTRGLKLFSEFLGKIPEEILRERRETFGKSKYYETKTIEFFEWLQKEKGLTSNSSRSFIIAVQSFFNYYDVGLKLRNKLPHLHMKLNEQKISIDDIREIYKYSDLTIKAWISLSRDCPARISDLLEFRRKQIAPEFLIESRKEKIIGKVFLSAETIDLLHKLWNTVPESEYAFSTPSGNRYDESSINKMLKNATEKAELKINMHQHLFRKLFVTTAINLGIQSEIIKILTFKAVDQSFLTYFLDREDLRREWQKVTEILALAPQSNGRVSQVEQELGMLKETLASVEKENAMSKVRIDNLQKTAMELEDRLNKYGDLLAHWVEFGDFTEAEKEAMRRRYNIKEFSTEEKQLMQDLMEITMELQKEKGYLDEEDQVELKKRFEEKFKKREMAKKRGNTRAISQRSLEKEGR